MIFKITHNLIVSLLPLPLSLAWGSSGIYTIKRVTTISSSSSSFNSALPAKCPLSLFVLSLSIHSLSLFPVSFSSFSFSSNSHPFHSDRSSFPTIRFLPGPFVAHIHFSSHRIYHRSHLKNTEWASECLFSFYFLFSFSPFSHTLTVPQK